MLERDFLNGIIATGAERLTDGDIKEYIYNLPTERLEPLSKSIYDKQGEILAESLYKTGKNDYFDLDWRRQFDRLQFALSLINDRTKKPGAQQQPAKKGQPKKHFKEAMLNDANGKKLKALHCVMEGRKGKRAALVMHCANVKGWLETISAPSVEEEFGHIGDYSGFQRYYNHPKTSFTEEEITGMCKALDDALTNQ